MLGLYHFTKAKWWRNKISVYCVPLKIKNYVMELVLDLRNNVEHKLKLCVQAIYFGKITEQIKLGPIQYQVACTEVQPL